MIAARSHPSGEIAGALAEGWAAGLVVVESRNGVRWGWIECVTGARRMAVPAWPRLSRRHPTRIRAFIACHREHGPIPEED